MYCFTGYDFMNKCVNFVHSMIFIPLFLWTQCASVSVYLSLLLYLLCVCLPLCVCVCGVFVCVCLLYLFLPINSLNSLGNYCIIVFQWHGKSSKEILFTFLWGNQDSHLRKLKKKFLFSFFVIVVLTNSKIHNQASGLAPGIQSVRESREEGEGNTRTKKFKIRMEKFAFLDC